MKLHAFWLISGPDPANEPNAKTVLDFLARRSLGTEIWYMFDPPRGFDRLPQQKKVELTAGAVRYIAEAAQKFRSKVGLYNHGGWYGEPENQIAVINSLGLKNVGIVYNFHHAHHQIEQFPRLFALMEPHLLAVNLNGMRQGGPKILPLGEGDHELAMMRVIQESAYRGPIGILHHRPELDAEQGLKQNLDGMKELLGQLSDEEALSSYGH